MHFIDGEPVGSINYADLEEKRKPQQEGGAPEKAPPRKRGGETVTSEDVVT